MLRYCLARAFTGAVEIHSGASPDKCAHFRQDASYRQQGRIISAPLFFLSRVLPAIGRIPTLTFAAKPCR
jgi:hypothetical protein